MATAKSSRPARSYRFRAEDMDLIDRLRNHLSASIGPRVAEVDILRAGLRSLARETGLIGLEKKSKKIP